MLRLRHRDRRKKCFHSLLGKRDLFNCLLSGVNDPHPLHIGGESKRCCTPLVQHCQWIKAIHYLVMTSAPKRPRLSIATDKKQEICLYTKNHPCLSKVELASHFNIPRTTLNEILKKSDQYLRNSKNRRCKRIRRGKFEDLEEVLFQWFVQKRTNNVTITDELLKEKAKMLGKQMGEFTAVVS